MKPYRFGTVLGCFVLLVPSLVVGQAAERRPWAEVAAPVLQSYGPTAGEPQRLAITVSMLTATDGADKLVFDLLGADNTAVESRTLGKSRNDLKTVEFVLTRSGAYRIRVGAYRTGIPEPKILVTEAYTFALPLGSPRISARNLGQGSVLVEWDPVLEATEYQLLWTDKTDGSTGQQLGLKGPNTTVNRLAPGHAYDLVVTARRGLDASASDPFLKLVKNEVERVWNFAVFGQSSNLKVNRFEMLDSNNLRFRLFSATSLPSGQIDQKGGKFTTFHDGVSFYYTVIDPKTENFELTATFTVDFINPVPDGQEGFGLLAMDSLGAHGVSAVNHYTNSAGIIATKFEATVDGVKKTSKDTLGARLVSGITPEVLAQGDSGIAQSGLNVSKAFSYDTADLVQKGGVYTLTLKKTNTGYHVLYKNSVPGEPPIEHILYGTDKLAQLDPARDYVGFAVARGCNVTVSDVKWSTSDPKNDPPGVEEPPLLVPLVYKVDSPTATGTSTYPLVFTANADGTLTVTKRGSSAPLIDHAAIKAGVDYTKTFSLTKGQTDFLVSFVLDPAYSPAPRTKMGIPDGGQTLKPATGSFDLVHTVYHRTFEGPTIYVGPTASSLGQGTVQKPISLAMALAFVQPGQTILLAGGTYFLKAPLVIERGNDGTEKQRKTLKAGPGERPVLDFSFASGGFQAWGNWWLLEGFDLTRTPGDVNGLQVAGHQNIVRKVHTYECGGTGLQISGTSRETLAKWPRNNLVESCVSWGNNDPAQNNADGFAAKITTGAGNVFRHCIAYNNIDDGWDLFSKIESGPIAPVVIENCVAYRNGSLPDGSGNGDGNGFKLGGDGIAVAHVLRNSIAFANGASGITSNSDPAVILENNTSYGNKGANVNLYGKGTGERSFRVTNQISMKGGSPDVFKEMPELAAPDNYFVDAEGQTVNSEGKTLGANIFVQTDVNTVPELRADGTIDMKGLLVLTAQAPKGVGSTLK